MGNYSGRIVGETSGLTVSRTSVPEFLFSQGHFSIQPLAFSLSPDGSAH